MAFPDLDCPDQIEDLVRIFYQRVSEDDLLSPVFVGQAAVDWDEHVPKITAFWCKLELGLPGFNGVPTQKHAALSAVQPFRSEQFARWIWLFHDTVDSGWEGPHVESIKARAVMVARMQSQVVPTAEAWNEADEGAPR
ncbi:MAG: hemoglobin [Planctomycetota bacterium]